MAGAYSILLERLPWKLDVSAVRISFLLTLWQCLRAQVEVEPCLGDFNTMPVLHMCS